MKLEIVKPASALRKAHKKSAVKREQFELFKSNILKMFSRINENESEENIKNILADFLKDTYYKGLYEINTKGRQDLAIHNDHSASSTVGVIIEVKRPSNIQEMISVERTNTKALQELLLYFLQERYIHHNIDIKHLIVTNVYEWYIFDITEFERCFSLNKSLVKQFKEWDAGNIGTRQTSWFYNEIAAPVLANTEFDLKCVFIDLRDLHKRLLKDTDANESQLLTCFRLLSPLHILKKTGTKRQ